MEIIGHRGARGLAPENTTAGITHALRLGALDWIEFDVRHTRDGRIVVLHDPFTLHLTGLRLIRHQQASQLRTGAKQVAELADIIKVIGNHAKVNIEVKTARAVPAVVREIENLVAQGYSYDHFLVSSFFPHILNAVQLGNPNIPLGLLTAHWPYAFVGAIRRNLNLRAVGFYKLFATRRAIAQAKKQGLFTYAYTVNSLPAAKRLEAKGIDAIVTDYPDRMRSLRRP